MQNIFSDIVIGPYRIDVQAYNNFITTERVRSFLNMWVSGYVIHYVPQIVICIQMSCIVKFYQLICRNHNKILIEISFERTRRSFLIFLFDREKLEMSV